MIDGNDVLFNSCEEEESLRDGEVRAIIVDDEICLLKKRPAECILTVVWGLFRGKHRME